MEQTFSWISSSNNTNLYQQNITIHFRDHSSEQIVALAMSLCTLSDLTPAKRTSRNYSLGIQKDKIIGNIS